MSFEYEKLMGYIGDIIEGDGTKIIATYIDCPICKKPLEIMINKSDRGIDIFCVNDKGHMNWHGHYDNLPEWIDDYKKLNK